MIIQMCVQDSDGECATGEKTMSGIADVRTVHEQRFSAGDTLNLDPTWRQKP
jgi:hypothetical protein